MLRVLTKDELLNLMAGLPPSVMAMDAEETITTLATTVIEKQAEIERLTDRAEKAEVDAEFFKGEVKLRNRISVTSEGMANLQFQLESANAEIERLREALGILWSWCRNWDAEFIYDDEFDRAAIESALGATQ